jgi:hypothetical protein
VLTGTADPGALGPVAAMDGFDVEPAVLRDVEILQVAFEMSTAARETTLPPALHPTNPPMVVVLAWKVAASPWGPFAMAQARVSCRSGARPRGFVAAAVVDNEAAATGLAAWGLGSTAGTVALDRGYHATTLEVRADGRPALAITAVDPDPLATGDVQYLVTLSMAQTPNGLRLVQSEPEPDLRRVERLRPRLEGFDADALGAPLLAPRHPVGATVAVGDIAMPALRFTCRPDVLAFEGTESVR